MKLNEHKSMFTWNTNVKFKQIKRMLRQSSSRVCVNKFTMFLNLYRLSSSIQISLKYIGIIK